MRTSKEISRSTWKDYGKCDIQSEKNVEILETAFSTYVYCGDLPYLKIISKQLGIFQIPMLSELINYTKD